jgi:hypothetical protein
MLRPLSRVQLLYYPLRLKSHQARRAFGVVDDTPPDCLVLRYQIRSWAFQPLAELNWANLGERALAVTLISVPILTPQLSHVARRFQLH